LQLIALVDQFPKRKSLFNSKMAELELNPADTSTDINTPVGDENVAASVNLNFRHADNSNQANDYADTTG